MRFPEIESGEVNENILIRSRRKVVSDFDFSFNGVRAHHLKACRTCGTSFDPCNIEKNKSYNSAESIECA